MTNPGTASPEGAGLAGAVAIVTGAGGGIGAAIAHALRSRGVRLALVDLDEAALDKTVAELGDGGGADVVAFVTDLTDDDLVAALPDRVRDRFGAVDVLVNNAGVRQIASMLDLTPEQWRHTLDVDLTAPFVLSRAVIPGMLEQGRGKIVNIASVAGQLAFDHRAAYCAAKAGLIMLTKTITLEFGSRGVWCNAIGPGVVETPMTGAYFRDDAMAGSIREKTPMERWGRPEEIAGPVAFLCGPESDYVNGTTLFVDGGWTAAKTY